MPKRRREIGDLPANVLPSLLHQGGVSIAGLAKVIAVLRGSGSSGTQWDRIIMGDANSQVFHRIKCVDVVRMVSGEPWSWFYIEPGKLLTAMLTESVGLQALFEGAWARSPATPQTPWSLLVAFDEFVPGNKLATDQTRKTMVLSFSFLELGGAALARGTAWCTPVTVRSATITKVQLAIQVFLGLALKYFFWQTI
jgi:hypothetical protein